MSECRILVTGATGNVGSAVVQTLVAESHPVVAAVRNAEEGRRKLGEGPSYVTFDFAQPQTHGPALEGVDRLFLVRPMVASGSHQMLVQVLQAAKRAGVRQVAYLSVSGADRMPFNPHRSAEKAVRESGIPWTFLRPGFFMQNLSMHHTRLIRERGEICVPAGQARTAFIDTRDIGEAGARVLTESGHENRAYTLTGGEVVTYDQVAQVFTEVWGRPIRYSNPSPLAFRREMMAQGYPSGFANFMILLYFTTRVGLASAVTPDLERILGRRPRTMRDYATDYATHFAPVLETPEREIQFKG